MENALTANNDNIQGIIGTTDALCTPILAALEVRGLTGKIPITGQDADLVACQRIVEGTQLMTIYKPIKLLNKAACDIAYAALTGADVNSAPQNGVWTEYDNSTDTKVATFKCEVVAVTKDNMMGVIAGSLNGFIVAYTGLAPFIVTLATQMLFYGFAYIVSGGFAIAPLPDAFQWLGQAYMSNIMGIIFAAISIVALLIYKIYARKEKIKYNFEVDSMTRTIVMWLISSIFIVLFTYLMNMYMGVPIPVLIMIFVTLILTFVANKTTWGRSIYAIGGNREAAHYSGIKVKRNWMFVFILQSVMAVFAGMILAAKVNSGSMSTATNLHLDAIAGAVIGGTSMRGGVGKVSGAILGAIFMTTIDNGMSMLNVGVSWQYIVKGTVLATAVIFDVMSKNRKK